jgi:signal transduction histidine kinase
MFGFTTTRRLRTELAAARAEADRLRDERDEALDQRAVAVRNREQILRQLAEADATNRRVHDRNLELGRRLSALAEADPEYAAELERKVAELQKRLDDAARELADGEWRGRARRAEKRVAHLEKELDNACGMPPGGILNSAPWQPGYKAERDKQVAP